MKFNRSSVFSLFIVVLLSFCFLLTCEDDFLILYRDWKKCFEPEFNPGSGRYRNEAFISLICKSKGSIIYYTMDGSDPTYGSAVYSDPIHITNISGSTVIKAFAAKEGLLDSSIISGTFSIQYDPDRVLPPDFNPPAGTYGNDIEVTLSSQTSGARIYYTLDGSDPTDQSTLYENPISISGNNTEVTIKAMAVADGMVNSTITSANYLITINQVVAPVFSLTPGTYTSDQTLMLSTTTPNATIYYTLDGSEPLNGGSVYSDAISLSNPNYPENATTYTIRAAATASGFVDSIETVGEFIITGQVAAPNIVNDDTSMLLCDEVSATDIDITIETLNAAIYYTTDGSDPSDLTGTLYEDNLSICGEYVTIKAVAYRDGWDASSIVEKTYASRKIIDSLDFDAYDAHMAYSHLGYYGIVYLQNNGSYNRIYFIRVDQDGNLPSAPLDVFAGTFSTYNMVLPDIAYHQVDENTGYFGVVGKAITELAFQAINASDGQLYGTGTSTDMVFDFFQLAVINSAPCADFSVIAHLSDVTKRAMLGKIYDPYTSWSLVPTSFKSDDTLNNLFLTFNPDHQHYGLAFTLEPSDTEHRVQRFNCALDPIADSDILIESSTSDTYNEGIIYDQHHDQYIFLWKRTDGSPYLIFNEIPYDATSSTYSDGKTQIEPGGSNYYPAMVSTTDFTALIWYNTSPKRILYSALYPDGSIDPTYNMFSLSPGGTEPSSLDLALGDDQLALVYTDNTTGNSDVVFMRFPLQP